MPVTIGSRDVNRTVSNLYNRFYTFLDGMPDDGEAVMLTYEPSSGSRRPSSDMVAELPTGKA